MKIYQAISSVMSELATHGIQKNNTNQQQRYNFRGIDDIYNSLARSLSKNGIVIFPRVLSRECVERSTKNGGALFYTTLHCEFDFVCAEDSSKHTVAVFGEAMDSADKSTNKAMSAAYKYACLQTFCIPTEGDNDADATTHEVISKLASVKHIADAVHDKIQQGDEMAVGEIWAGVTEEEASLLWTAVSKNGFFSQAEKEIIRRSVSAYKKAVSEESK